MAAPASYWLRHFRLLLWNHWMEFNETWKEARFQLPLPSLWFSGRSERQDGHPGLWLTETFSTFPLWPLFGIQQNLEEARSKRPLPRLCFSGRLEKQDGHSGFWLAETFSASPLKPMNGIQQNSHEARSQSLLSRLCFSGLSEEQDSRPGLWLAEAFRFLLWNHWMEFNKIWQDARSQRPLISLCFSGRSEEKDGRPASDLPRHFDFSSVTTEQDSTKLDRKQDLSVLYQFVLFGPIKKGRPGLWLAETFSTSPLWPLNRIQRNLTGSKISTSSTKFVLLDRRNLTGSKISMSYTKFGFFGSMRKTRWLPRPLIDWDIFDFSSERNSTKLNRK